jgi:hypothetical protein
MIQSSFERILDEEGAKDALLGRVLALIFQGLRAEVESGPRAPRGEQP